MLQSCKTTAKKCTIKCAAHAKLLLLLLFFLLRPVDFFAVLSAVAVQHCTILFFDLLFFLVNRKYIEESFAFSLGYVLLISLTRLRYLKLYISPLPGEIQASREPKVAALWVQSRQKLPKKDIEIHLKLRTNQFCRSLQHETKDTCSQPIEKIEKKTFSLENYKS